MRDAYVTRGTLEAVVTNLSDRNRAVLLDLARLRVLTGDHLERLHFANLAPGSRERTRRRVLARLAEQQLVAMLERTIGGARAGSVGHVYSLGIAGQRALPLFGADVPMHTTPARARAPWTPGALFLSHSLAVATLYVALRDHERASDLTLGQFQTEPASWHPDDRGALIKPDAYVRIQSPQVEDCWWIEVDRATESIPTLARKLRAYVDFARRGGVGPDGVMPRVLVTVPHDRRLTAAQEMINEIPPPAAELITIILHDQAATLMIKELDAP